ncbi:hypothetical protein XA68_16563 [Ophiocordyceps unilateralis]|uniref:Myb-like domain-containing protein n=1 Tax=Ophiocordyceps unilateralis TaxID=268505 RepID=A0A2A9PLC2_OPHUN|nr:hypothetical protein XA68_16563 [Ophiocordyceps unilateralis]
MSSMLKKKGGLAFKPKIPSARSRPVNAPPAPTPRSIESQPAIDATLEAASVPVDGLGEVPGSTTNSPSLESRTAHVSTEQASHTSPRPVSEIAETVDSGVAQADTSPPHTAGTEATLPPTLEPATTVSSISPPGPLSEPPAERRPSQAAFPETSSEPTPEEAVPVLSNDSETGPSTDLTTPAPSGEKPTRKPRKGKADTQSNDVPQKRQRRKATKEGETVAPRPRRKRKADAEEEDGPEPKKKRGRARSVTPEDAESQVVDLQQLKMADLTKDLRIGKKFSRHDELRDRERQARSKTKPTQEDEEPTTSDAPSASTLSKADGSPQDPSTNNGGSGDANSSSAPATKSGPQFRIVDGQIVVDQNSLVMDRHARAAAAQARGDMETVEENDFTRLITSSSFMTSSKLKGPNIWTVDETELFYRGLRMFGTEFEMISKMFPGKQRRHIKLKFNREERHNPKGIDAALIGEKTIKMDIEEYRTFTGAVYESVETIEAEQRKIGERYEQERQRIADEQAETMRKKREALFADDDNADNVPADGRKKRAANKRKGKQAVAYGLNGEPINQGGD